MSEDSVALLDAVLSYVPTTSWGEPASTAIDMSDSPANQRAAA
jgi:hypothetical protein